MVNMHASHKISRAPEAFDILGEDKFQIETATWNPEFDICIYRMTHTLDGELNRCDPGKLAACSRPESFSMQDFS